jgi:transcriptional regulator with XRE-family HTH domain
MNVALKQAIVATQRTQQDIAREAKLHPTRLSQIIHNERTASPVERASLAAVLKKSESELFPDDDAPVGPDAPGAAHVA